MNPDQEKESPGEPQYKEGLYHILKTQYYSALLCFKESAQSQYPASYLYLQSLYYKGLGVPILLSEAEHWELLIKQSFEWFKSKATSNDPDGLYNLGYCYLFGVGVKKDEKEGVKYISFSAERGYAFAQSLLAFCYQTGVVVDTDYSKAFRYYELSADQGHSFAQFSLGLCYKNSYGVDRNTVEMIRYFKISAEQGCPSAQYELGICYDSGAGVPPDIREAIRYFSMAAAQEHLFSKSILYRYIKKIPL